MEGWSIGELEYWKKDSILQPINPLLHFSIQRLVLHLRMEGGFPDNLADYLAQQRL